MNSRRPTSYHHRFILLFLLVMLGSQLSAYQQGTYFLFDIRDDAADTGSKGRITVAASIFKNKAASADQVIAKDEPKSEFESDLLGFGSTSSQKETDTSKLLEIETKDTEGQSSFGENPKESTGFYFNY